MAYSRDSFEYMSMIDCVADHGQVAGQIHMSRTKRNSLNISREDVPGHYIGTYRKHPFYYSVYMQDESSTDEKKSGTQEREQPGATTFQPECPVCLDETGQPIPISGFEGPLGSDEDFSDEQSVYHLESDSADTVDKNTTKLLVTNLPSLLPTAQYKEFLEMFFEYKRKENGHVVVSVDLDEDNSMAMVEIEDSKSADVLLQKRPISMLGTVIGVDIYIPEPMCTVEVRGPADILVRIILQLYFENTKKSNGDEIEKIEIIENEDEKVAYITFETEEVARRVVSKDQHTIDKKHLLVELYTPKPKIAKKQSNIKSRELENHDTRVNKEHIVNKQGDNDGVVAVVGVETNEDLSRSTTYGDILNKGVYQRDICCELEEVLTITDSGATPVPPPVDYSPYQALSGLDSGPYENVPSEKHYTEGTLGHWQKPYGQFLGQEHTHWQWEKHAPMYPYVPVFGQMPTATIEEQYPEQEQMPNVDGPVSGFYENWLAEKQTIGVAKAVADRNHNVDGVDLSVCLYTPPKPRPYYENRVLIEGVKTSTTKDCLFNFLEAKTGSIPETLVYGDKDGVLVVTFETNPDFEKLEKVSKKVKLEGASLKITRVTISNCLIVTNIPENTSHDTLEFYFENQRRSGGGPVEKVFEQDDGSVLVYFNDHEVIDNVLKQPHTINGKQIHVNLYLDQLRVTQGDGSEPKSIQNQEM